MSEIIFLAQLAGLVLSAISIIALVCFNWHHLKELKASRFAQNLPLLKSNMKLDLSENRKMGLVLSVANIGRGPALNASIRAVSLEGGDLKGIRELYSLDVYDQYLNEVPDIDELRKMGLLSEYRKEAFEMVNAEINNGIITPGEIGYKTEWYPGSRLEGFLVIMDYSDVYNKKHQSAEIITIRGEAKELLKFFNYPDIEHKMDI